MHPARRILLAALALLLPAPILAQSARTPVLVELFTSEGCSDCPPADALLARLQQDQPVPNADIIALEEHVDYWESLGWHDRFSSHLVTDRQSLYVQRLHANDDYTPQMIVDGTAQFVGSNSVQALHSIAQSAHTPKLALTLSPIAIGSGHLTASVSLAPGSIAIPKSDLYAAVVQPMASTQVQRGENGGHTLNHVSVLRSLQRIGSPSDATSAPLNFSLPIPTDAPASTFRIVVFLQRADQGPILAAVSSARSITPASATSVASAHTH
jgi:hypothetical protein